MLVDLKRAKIIFPIFLGVSLSIGFLLGFFFTSDKRATAMQYPFSEIAEVSQLLEKYYFDSVSAKKLTQEAIRGMLANLDPHSSYISKEETEQTNAMLMGEFEGIGIQFNVLNDTVLVISVNAGGPSQKAGLLPGDKIIWVDSIKVANVKIQNTEIIRLLRGKKGTSVKVGILRQNISKPLYFKIIRDKIPVHSVVAAYMIAPQIAYININNFAVSTGEEFHKALKDLVLRQNADKLIIDLRGNPGGYLESAIKICDDLLPAKKLIVYTYGQAVGKQNYYADKGGIFTSDKQQVVVLIDEYSASASEIVAGALQDHDRGIVIGRRSFGKGLVQRQFNLQDGSEVMITVARYYTPTGRCIQRPFESENMDDYYNDIYNRYQKGEMQSADSITFPDSLCFLTPKGKKVYGGGGIMPDIFIPIEKSDSIIYFNVLNNQQIVFLYAVEYADKNRTQIKEKYPKGADFIKNFTINEAMLKEILAKNQVTELKKQPLPKESAQMLRQWLKAYIGRNLYGDNTFYQIVNQEDKVIQAAIREFKNVK
jgi:carboxyl-terminal processing protease